MGFKSFFGHRKEEIQIVFDIGSGSVGGAFIHFRGSKKPSIIYKVRRKITVSKNAEVSKLSRAMFEALESVSDNLAKEGLKHLNFTGLRLIDIAAVHAVYSSPWYHSLGKKLKVKRDEEITVSGASLARILEKEKEASEKKNEERITYMERKILDIKLNGYEISEPLGKKAKMIEIWSYISAAETGFLKKTERLIHKNFSASVINHHTFMMTAFSVIRDLYRESDFIFIDVTGEITDLAVIKDGAIKESGSIPLGRNTLIRKTAEAKKGNPEEAESSLKGALEDALTEPDGTIKEILEEFAAEWAGALEELLSDLGDASYFPPRIYLTADHDVLEYFRKNLEKSSISRQNIQRKKAPVRIIDEDSLKGKVSAGPGKKDVFLMLEAMFFDKLFKVREETLIKI